MRREHVRIKGGFFLCLNPSPASIKDKPKSLYPLPPHHKTCISEPKVGSPSLRLREFKGKEPDGVKSQPQDLSIRSADK